MAADLDALCKAHGIATRYRDFWQREHVATDATKRALLAAMGVDVDAAASDDPRRAGSDGSAPTLDAAGHAKPLDPAQGDVVGACVVRIGDHATRIRVADAQAIGEGAVDWQVVAGAGAQPGGHARIEHAGEPSGARAAVLVLDDAALAGLAPGDHTLRLRREGAQPLAVPLLACPRRAVAPHGAARRFGPAVQLYALRSRRNWGIGDFTDLATLARLAAREGADFVGLNPLHELFVDRPAQASPYSPSSRLAVNPLYLDVEAVPDLADAGDVRADIASASFQARLAALRAAPLVDYAGVAALKLPLLRRLHARFRSLHLAGTPSARGQAFRAFAGTQGRMLDDAALFDALQERFVRDDPSVWGWPAWPPAYRDRHGPAVAAFAATHADSVEFHLWLQWQCDVQLGAAAAAAREAGMTIGLYRDLAVGANPGGADTWREPARYASGVHVGAPPDEFNQNGQDWGLPPWIPGRLAAGGYAPWVALLRANMRHAGGLRIDHVMGLMRLFWIPGGMSPTDGTYVRYPLDDLLAVLALESHRHGSLVVGEDLGTVPDEVRTALRDAGVQSYRVLYFERGADGELLSPPHYPEQALVTVSTHDLPTLRGYWEKTDLAARDALALFPSQALRDRTHAERSVDLQRLARALAREGLLPDDSRAAYGADFVRAVHAYVARTPCALMTVQLEDVFGEAEQVNLPATTDDVYPNWRRKITVDLDDWDADGRFAAIAATIRAQGRGRAT
jgi:(1->4)-alpha-D-glucan 1-alpha-D-glucosylmutase